jgi:zinc protease
MNRISLLALFLLTCVAAVSPAAAQLRGGQLLDPNLEPVFYPLADNVEVFFLENGLQVILMQNKAQPMVGIYTQVKVGSAREDYRTSGMSHMLEHLLFNGSEKYTQEQQYDMADRAGAYNNANTTDFFTNYMMVVPAVGIETGLELQSEMLFHSIIPQDKFTKEQGIVLGELVQSRDWPGHDAQVALRKALYAGSSLELPTMGTRSTIEHMLRDDVYDFYKRWYVPNNMVLTMAGNFDRDQAVELLEKYFGTPAPGTLDQAPLKPARLIERTSSLTRRVGDERILALSFEAPTYGLADYFPFEVMVQLLDLDGSGILTMALEDMEENERPDFSAYWERAEGFGRLTLEFTLKEGTDATAMYRLVQDAVTGAIDLGITGEDILGIVRMSETATLLEREQLRMTGIYIAGPVALGGPDFFLSYLDRLREVTAEDVTRALTNWLVDAPCLAVLLEPAAGEEAEGDGAPAGMQMPAGMKMPPAMAEAMKKMQAGGGPTKAGAEEPSAAEEKPAETVAAPLQVDRSELANGAVLVSQTNPDSPLMAIHLAVRGRAVIDRDNARAGALDLVHRMLEEGYAGCDKSCLARQLRRLGAVVKVVDDGRIPMDNYYTNGRFSFIRIETSAEHGPEVLDLVTREIQHASFDDADFERVRSERLEALGREQASARSTANGMLSAALYGDHPLALPPEGDTESLQAVDFNQIRTVYRRAFAPENLIFSIIGPHSHEDLKAIIENLLPGHGKPANGMPEVPVTTEAKVLTASVGGELTAIRLGSIIKVEKADEAALSLVTAILSDRMAMDLRETRGLSYSVGVSLELVGGLGEVTAWLNPPTERKDEGLAALKAFIADFDPATITQQEMDKIRSARSGRMMMRRLSSMGQAYYLAMAELEHDLPGYLGAMTAYDGVTLADLQTVTGKYLKTMPLIEVVVD